MASFVIPQPQPSPLHLSLYLLHITHHFFGSLIPLLLLPQVFSPGTLYLPCVLRPLFSALRSSRLSFLLDPHAFDFFFPPRNGYSWALFYLAFGVMCLFHSILLFPFRFYSRSIRLVHLFVGSFFLPSSLRSIFYLVFFWSISLFFFVPVFSVFPVGTVAFCWCIKLMAFGNWLGTWCGSERLAG